MASRKRHNRAVFTERLLHRYLWETYYEGGAAARRLLPDHLRTTPINLVVPEMVTKEGYNVDLELHMKDRAAAVPVEVKWQPSEFKKDNQVSYLQKHDGFGVSFAPTPTGTIKGTDIPLVAIDRAAFLEWLAKNISRLAVETMEAKGGESSAAPSHWLMMLKGQQMIANFRRMRAAVKAGAHSRPFWAFQNKPGTVRDLLQMRVGDRVLVIDGHIRGAKGHFLEGGSKAAQKHLLETTEWWWATVRTPYFMVVDPADALGTFFESGAPAIGDRVWPHFIDFDLEAGGRVARLAPLGEFYESFRASWNGGGVLANLSQPTAQSLADALRHFSGSAL